MKFFLKNILVYVSLVVFVCSCTESSPKLVPKESPADVVLKTQGSINTAVLNPMWDIIFVVDDSGSMGPVQENLALNVNKFTEAIYNNKLIDFHIGVITTTGLDNPATFYAGPGNMPVGGGTVPQKNCCGRLVGQTVKFVTRDTVDGISILANNLIVGTSGSSSEALFDPLYLALDPKGPVAMYHNQGFYREEAMLAIIFVTDTDDQSKLFDGYSLSQFLLQLKGGDAKKIFLAAANVSDEDHAANICKGEADQIPTNSRMMDFFRMMGGGSIFSICDMDFGVKLANLGLEISQKAQTMYLQQVPKNGSIKVTMGGESLRQDPVFGWSYDPSAVAIRFGLGIPWDQYPPNTLPEISFSVLDPNPTEK